MVWSDPNTLSGYIVSHKEFDGIADYPKTLQRSVTISFNSSAVQLTFISVGIHYYSEDTGFWFWRQREYLCDDFLFIFGLRDQSRKLCGDNNALLTDGHVITIYPDAQKNTSFFFVTRQIVIERQWPLSDEIRPSESSGFLMRYHGESRI